MEKCARQHTGGVAPTTCGIISPVPLALVVAPPNWLLPSCAAGAVVLLLVLIARVRLHPALALITTAFALGLASGMPLGQVPLSFSMGVGNLMGHIAIVLGLGAILGGLLARSGGATALGNALVAALRSLAAAGRLRPESPVNASGEVPLFVAQQLSRTEPGRSAAR